MQEMPRQDAPIVEQAVWLASMGYRVFPCVGKAPAIPTPKPHKRGCKGQCGMWGHGCYDATTDEATLRAMWAHYPGSNIGLATGGVLAVIDIDVRNGGMEAWIDLEATYEVLSDTVTCLSGSGGGSQHKYVLVPEGMKLKKDLVGGINLKGEGGYVIAPPSVHPETERPYVWEADFGPDDLHPIPAPAWLLALMRAEGPSHHGTTHGATPGARASGVPPGLIEAGGRNDKLTSLAGSMRHAGLGAPAIYAALSVVNQEQCQPPLDTEEVERISTGMERYRPAASMVITRQAVPFGQPREYAQAANDVSPGRDWWKDTPWWQYSVEPYVVNKKGKIEANNTTLIAVLKNHPDWVGRLWWDDLAGKIMLQNGEDATELDDAQITRIGADFGDKYYIAVHSDTLMGRCLLAVAQEHKRDPLRHYLHTLPGWDMQPRLDRWLLDCAGVTDTAYHRFCSRNLMVSMIARALDPGCICRSVLILEGPEEYRKSTFVSHLVPQPEWFDEISGSLDSKEAHLMVQGLWVAELSELDSLGRTEETRLKSFISLRVDAYIPKFKSIRVQPKRRTVFVGTTNDSVYFKGTGNTRFLPVKIVTPMDIEYFLTIRAQLYAEAMVYYGNNPEQWWRMDEDATREAAGQREQRRQASMIEDDFSDWLYRRRFIPHIKDNAEFVPEKYRVSMPEIMTGYYGLLSREKWKDAAYERQPKTALKALGWTPGDPTTVTGPIIGRMAVRPWTCNPLNWPAEEP